MIKCVAENCTHDAWCAGCMSEPPARDFPCGNPADHELICDECEFGYEVTPENDSYNDIARARMEKIKRERENQDG